MAVCMLSGVCGPEPLGTVVSLESECDRRRAHKKNHAIREESSTI